MDVIGELTNIRHEIMALKANKRVNFEQLSYTQKSMSFNAAANGYYTVHAICTPSTPGRLPVVDYSMTYINNVYPVSALWYLNGGKPDLELIVTPSGAARTIQVTICGFNLKDVSFSVSKTG